MTYLRVESNQNVTPFIKELVLRLPESKTLNFMPGSHMLFDIPVYKLSFREIEIDPAFTHEWDRVGAWKLTGENKTPCRRLYSVASHPLEGDFMKFNIRLATPPVDRDTGDWVEGIPPGIASGYLFSLQPGDTVSLEGPYGDFNIREGESEMIYIGGGSGMAPLRSHLFDLFRNGEPTERKVSYWYGARSKTEIFYESDFRWIEEEYPNFRFEIALSDPQPGDNWISHSGFIHEVVLKKYLQDHSDPTGIEYYVCGPPPMANAVRRMLKDLGVPAGQIICDDY